MQWSAIEKACKSGNVKVFVFLLLLGSTGFSVNHFDPGLDVLFISFILGIASGYFLGKEVKETANRILKVLLPISIALYGFNIHVPTASMELEKVALTLLLSFTIFASVFAISRRLGNSKELSILLSCGSGVCGLSAIAIISPIVKPKKEEFSTAIVAITVAGLLCTILYPPLAKILFPADKFYLLAGSTLPQTGLVKISASVFGEEEVVRALSVKAIRIAMIAVAAFALSFVYSEKKFYVPWFIVAFLMTAFLSSYFGDAGALKSVSTILFASTLAGIGINVELRDLYFSGFRPLIAVLCGIFVSLIVFLLIVGGGMI